MGLAVVPNQAIGVASVTATQVHDMLLQAPDDASSRPWLRTPAGAIVDRDARTVRTATWWHADESVHATNFLRGAAAQRRLTAAWGLQASLSTVLTRGVTRPGVAGLCQEQNLKGTHGILKQGPAYHTAASANLGVSGRPVFGGQELHIDLSDATFDQ